MSRLQRGIDLTNASRSDNARPCKPLLALRHAQHGSASHVRLHPGSQTPLTVTTHCNNENSTAATERYGASRRMALACAGAALVAWRDPPTARWDTSIDVFCSPSRCTGSSTLSNLWVSALITLELMLGRWLPHPASPRCLAPVASMLHRTPHPCGLAPPLGHLPITGRLSSLPPPHPQG